MPRPNQPFRKPKRVVIHLSHFHWRNIISRPKRQFHIERTLPSHCSGSTQSLVIRSKTAHTMTAMPVKKVSTFFTLLRPSSVQHSDLILSIVRSRACFARTPAVLACAAAQSRREARGRTSTSISSSTNSAASSTTSCATPWSKRWSSSTSTAPTARSSSTASRSRSRASTGSAPNRTAARRAGRDGAHDRLLPRFPSGARRGRSTRRKHSSPTSLRPGVWEQLHLCAEGDRAADVGEVRVTDRDDLVREVDYIDPQDPSGSRAGIATARLGRGTQAAGAFAAAVDRRRRPPGGRRASRATTARTAPPPRGEARQAGSLVWRQARAQEATGDAKRGKGGKRRRPARAAASAPPARGRGGLTLAARARPLKFSLTTRQAGPGGKGRGRRSWRRRRRLSDTTRRP